MNILIITATVPLYIKALARSLSADTSFRVATQNFQVFGHTACSVKPDLVLLTLGQSVSDCIAPRGRHRVIYPTCQTSLCCAGCHRGVIAPLAVTGAIMGLLLAGAVWALQRKELS